MEDEIRKKLDTPGYDAWWKKEHIQFLLNELDQLRDRARPSPSARELSAQVQAITQLIRSQQEPDFDDLWADLEEEKNQVSTLFGELHDHMGRIERLFSKLSFSSNKSKSMEPGGQNYKVD